MSARHAGRTPAPGGRRVRPALVVALAETLTEREWQVMEMVNRLRLVTGLQLERVIFADLTGKSRSVVRWRVLKRLVDCRVLAPLARRVGGSLRGSAQLAYALDVVGERLLRLRRNLRQDEERVRRAAVPGERFVRHTLAVSELYVALAEQARMGDLRVDDFRAEPAAWWPNGVGGWMKPDAYVSLSTEEVTDHWWVEVDLATEAVPTLRGKFLAYVDFANQGQLGPADIVPRVLVTVPSEGRQEVIRQVVSSLPAPAEELFRVVLQADSAATLTMTLLAPDQR